MEIVVADKRGKPDCALVSISKALGMGYEPAGSKRVLSGFISEAKNKGKGGIL